MNPLDIAKGMFVAGDAFNELKKAGVFKWNNNRMKKGGMVQPSGRIKAQDVMKKYNKSLNKMKNKIKN